MTHLQVGSTITATSDSFIVKETLGEGTFGAVALCRRTSSDQSVALKVIKNQQHVVFGLMETKILQMLKKYRAENQFIVRWFSAFHSGDTYCLEFEPLDISLGDFLNQSGKMSPLQIRPVLFQLSTAFKFLSNLGLIHGDLKSMNIMMVDHKTSLQVKLIDFGGAHFSSHVRSGDMTQTFWYRAPEVWLRTCYTEAIDMWSLGCVALEMISGRELFPTDNETDMLSYIVCSVGNPPDSLLRKAIHSHKSIDQTTAEGALIWTLKQYKCISLETLSLDQELDWINFVDLVLNLLSLKPETRISPAQVLDHPFITMSYITNVYNTAYVRRGVELMGSFLSRCEVQIETEEQPSSSRSEGPARILQQERPREEGNKTDRQPQESRPKSRPDSSQSSTPECRPDSSQSSTPECRPESRQWSSSQPGQWSSPEPGQWSSPEPGQWSSPEPGQWPRQESIPESRPDSSLRSRPESRQRSTLEPRQWSRREPKQWSRREPKQWSRPEPKQWSRPEPREWSRPEPKQWSRPEPKQWSRPEPKQWSRPEPREWSRLERRQRSISNSRRRSRSESRQSFRPQPRECSKLECRQWSRLKPRECSQPKPREWPRPEPRQRSRSNSRQKSRSGSRQSFRPQPRECSQPEPRQWSRLEPRQRSRSNSRRRSGSRQSFRPQPRECSQPECRQWSRLEPRQRSRSNSRRRSRSGSRQSFRPEPKKWSTLEPRQWSRPDCRQWSRPEPRQRSRQRQTLNMERPTSTTQSESRSDFRSITETTRPEKRSREEDRCGDKRCLVNKRRWFPPGPQHRSRAKDNRLVGRH